eukprot:CAMPEP_0206427778 /NCGR_PEP_ID=MMETSP0324_2-20121206/5248_1 /ASSEMBLY_ACC=CAM_ASM_000836 /TAXON_ID=2866 /ORGANISM="Crypthecodinium cohnii, Strain Seligo" /LENGTH=1067 /DNA_ID=CAMNT_0053893133 /DNA_START=63 /DNA_END=3267 /DNA_ORIENTATION=-
MASSPIRKEKHQAEKSNHKSDQKSDQTTSQKVSQESAQTTSQKSDREKHQAEKSNDKSDQKSDQTSSQTASRESAQTTSQKSNEERHQAEKSNDKSDQKSEQTPSQKPDKKPGESSKKASQKPGQESDAPKEKPGGTDEHTQEGEDSGHAGSASENSKDESDSEESHTEGDIVTTTTTSSAGPKNPVRETLENFGLVADKIVDEGTAGNTSKGEHGGSSAATVGVHQNSQKDAEMIGRAFLFSTVFGSLCLAAWMLLCKCFPEVYMFRATPGLEGYDESLPTPDASSEALQNSSFSNAGGSNNSSSNNTTNKPRFYAWWRCLSQVEEEQAVRIAGLDSYMLCEFHVLCRDLLLLIAPATVLGLGLPQMLFGATSDVRDQPFDWLTRVGLSATTAPWEDAHKYETSDPTLLRRSIFLCWAQVLVIVIVVAVAAHRLEQAQLKFLKLRFQWLKTMPRNRATTLMVEHIPRKLRSDESLKNYFLKIFSRDSVRRAYIVRKASTLRSLQQKVKDKEYELAVAEASLRPAEEGTPRHTGSMSCWARLQMCFRFRKTTEQDILRLSQSLDEASESLRREQRRVEQGVRETDLKYASSSAFVTFTSRRWCRMASREQLLADAYKMQMSQPPDVSDVRYQDLERNPALALTNEIIAGTLTTFLFFSWLPLTVFLTSLTSLNAMLQYKGMAWLRPICDAYPAFNTFLESVLATLVLRVFLAFLPTLMLMIIYNFLNLKGGCNAQLMMQNRYFAFMLVFVVLVSALNHTLIHSLVDLADNPNHIFVMFSKLPSSSNFYSSYLILGWFTLVITLLRPSNLVLYLYYKHWGGLAPSAAREMSEPEDQNGDGMGARMAVGTIMMSISLIFSNCSPLIVPAGLGYFCIATETFRWRILYTETRKPDLGGAFWVLGLKHLYLSLTIYIVLMATMFMRAPIHLQLPVWALLVVGIWFGTCYVRFTHLTWEVLPFEEIAQADLEHGRSLTRLRSDVVGEVFEDYCQEECRVEEMQEDDGHSECQDVDKDSIDRDLDRDVVQDNGTFKVPALPATSSMLLDKDIDDLWTGATVDGYPLALNAEGE